VTKCFAGYTAVRGRLAIAFPVSGSILVMRSISSPNISTRTACSSYAG
jgi:hypothetical protein